jgi:hypothetical protein
VCASRAVVLDMFQKRVVHFCATDLKRVCAFSFFESCLKPAKVQSSIYCKKEEEIQRS